MIESAYSTHPVSIAGTMNTEMASFLGPLLSALTALSITLCTLVLCVAGYQYMSSRGNPEQVALAKKTITRALLGLSLVLGATVFVNILNVSYQTPAASTELLPQVLPVTEVKEAGGLAKVVQDAIIGFFSNLITASGEPVISALNFFTRSTPYVADNPQIANLWLVVLAICNSVFVLVVTLLGLQFMSATVLGLPEITFRQLVPRLAVVFVAMNSSLFVIDILISLSNGMISAIPIEGGQNIFSLLQQIIQTNEDANITTILLLGTFVIIGVLLLVHYIIRIIVLYIGVLLAPLVVMLYVLPGFKEFAKNAVRSYLVVIFTLFVHVLILAVAGTLFSGLGGVDAENTYKPFITTVGSVATLVVLLRSQQTIMQFNVGGSSMGAIRTIGRSFSSGVQSLTRTHSGSPPTSVVRHTTNVRLHQQRNNVVFVKGATK